MTTAVEAQAAPAEQPSEYDLLWAQVRSSETFDNWAKLATHTLKSGDIEKSRTVCDEFLSKYPLCYGYWQQYATAEAQHGDRAKVVYEQAVASTPYSPDIWGYYIEWLRKQEGVTAEEVRTLFGRALAYVGIDWHAHKIFDKWIAYEEEQQDNLQQVAHVYSVAICTPTQDLQRLNAAFLKFAAEHDVKTLLTEAELQQYTAEAKKIKQAAGAADATGVSGSASVASAGAVDPDEEMAPGVDEAPPGEPTLVNVDAMKVSDEEVKAAWLQAKASAFQQTEAVCSKVLPFESVIRRRWWHWNALQAPQLAAWWQYLDAVAADGDESALYGLHERCLVPCASYPEFWCRYFAFLNGAKTLPDVGTILNYAITRATRVFCRARPEVHLAAAAVLDARATAATSANGQQPADGEVTAAAEAREALRTVANDIAPRSATVAARLAHYERRSGDTTAARAALLAKLDEARANEDAAAAAELARACVTLERSLAAPSKGAVAAVNSNVADGGKENNAGGNGADEVPPGEEAAPGSKADTSDADVANVLEKVLEKFPGNRGLWDAAIAEKELLPWGEARARAILDVYIRALSAQKGTGDAAAAGEEASAATEGSVNNVISTTSSTALDLKIREAFVRSAIAAMDACGTPALTWEAYLLMIRIWGEKFATEATTAQKRPAQAPAAGQPDAKRAAGADAAAAAAQMHATHAPYSQHYQQHAAAAAYNQHYQQQAAHQQYYGGYDYSAYYAANPQQAAAYYGAYAYPPQQ